MATCNISSTFDITIVGPGDLNVAKTFTTTRAFTVVGCTTKNTNAGATTLDLSASVAGIFSATAAGVAGQGIVQAQAVAGPDMPVGIITTDIGAGEVITVDAGAATVTTVILHCVASGGGEAITIA